jgi:hypothetical protein
MPRLLVVGVHDSVSGASMLLVCLNFVISLNRPAESALIVEIKNDDGVSLSSGEPTMPFTFVPWTLIATWDDVGKTFSAPTDLLPIFNEHLTNPGTIFVQVNCCGGGSHDFFSPPLLNTGQTIDDPVIITRIAPNLGPNLFGYQITDVTQTIDELTITQVSGNRYNRRGTHTIRIWGEPIPEPHTCLLIVTGFLFCYCLRVRVARRKLRPS